jgi:hypothetical protein
MSSMRERKLGGVGVKTTPCDQMHTARNDWCSLRGCKVTLGSITHENWSLYWTKQTHKQTKEIFIKAAMENNR